MPGGRYQTVSQTLDIGKEPLDQMSNYDMPHNYVEGSVWFYAPKKVAPIVFAVLFGISGCVHAWQTVRYKSWRVTLLLPWSAALFVAGFAVREVGAHHKDDLGLLIASTVLVLSGPPVYSGADYFILGSILYYIPYLSPIHPGRVVTTFVGIDLIIEILIGNGAAKTVNNTLNPSEIRAGQILVKTALIMQAVAFIGLVAIALIFHIRAASRGLLNRNLKIVLYTLYASCALIFARCIYRIAEYFEGWTGTLYTHEAYFWVFEAGLMLANSVLLNVLHPGRYLPRSNRVYLGRDGSTEYVGPGWKDPRRWWWTVLDPFDLYGVIKGRDKKSEFWNDETAEVYTGQEIRRGKNEGGWRCWRDRPLWALLLDPLHLYGDRGWIAKGVHRLRKSEEVAPAVLMHPEGLKDQKVGNTVHGRVEEVA